MTRVKVWPSIALLVMLITSLVIPPNLAQALARVTTTSSYREVDPFVAYLIIRTMKGDQVAREELMFLVLDGQVDLSEYGFDPVEFEDKYLISSDIEWAAFEIERFEN